MKKELKLSIFDSYIDLLSDSGLVTYLELECMYYCSNEENLLISNVQLGYSLYGRLNQNRAEKETVRCGLEELCDKGLIAQINNKNYSFSPDIFNSNGEYYKNISVEAFKKLRHSPKLLRHYLLIIKSRNGSIEVSGVTGVISTMPISFFCGKESVSDSTIMRYNTTLEDMKLIYIRRANYSPDKGSRECNVYSLYEHRGLVDTYVGYYNRNDDSKANFRRRVSAQYNRFKNNPGCYSPEEIEKLKNDIERYNKEMTELGGDYLKKIKDISIFDLTILNNGAIV